MKWIHQASTSSRPPFGSQPRPLAASLLGFAFLLLLIQTTGCVSSKTTRTLKPPLTASSVAAPACAQPKEERIAFIARKGAAGSREGICTVRPDGTDLDCPGFPPAGSIGLDGAWSPDFSRVAVSIAPFYEMGRFQTRLYLFNADLASFAVLSDQESCWSPVWSPDGRKIAYHVRLPNRTDYDIWVIDVGTQAASPVTRGPAQELLGGWSADGERLFFLSDQGRDRLEVYAIRVDGSGRKQLTHTGLAKYGLKVSPGGDFLLFQSATVRKEGVDPVTGNPADEQLRLFWMKSDGSELEQIPLDEVIWNYSWTPQGDRILVLAGQPATVYVVGREGKEVRAVIQGESLDRYSPVSYPVAGSLDGRKVAFRCHTFDLCVSDYEGSQVQALGIRQAGLDVVGGIQWICR